MSERNYYTKIMLKKALSSVPGHVVAILLAAVAVVILKCLVGCSSASGPIHCAKPYYGSKGMVCLDKPRTGWRE